MEITRILTPVSHVVVFLWLDEKNKPRAKWLRRRRNIMDAPFVCMNRTSHPISTFRMIIITDWNDMLVEFKKCIDRSRPVTTWQVSTIPSMNPMFHHDEIEVGEGRSTRELLMMFNTSLFLRICPFI